jgi:hypothetical protein
MSRRNALSALAAVAAVLGLTACETVKSANATAPSVAGPIPGVNITPPKPLEPSAGATLTFNSTEPPTLLIENPGTSGVRPIWLQVEVSADAAFSQVVHQADRVEPGANGRTSYRLPEPLGAGYTYFWRARAADGANTGPYSETSSFAVVAPVVIDTPVPLEPAGTISNNRPDFKVRNATISGTSGVVYRFHISTTPDMSATTALVSAAPHGSGTTTVSLGSLPYNTTFYWRVWGTDGGTESPVSSVVSFRTSAAPAPPPPTTVPVVGVPTGGGGRTPDPAPGTRLSLPSYGESVVQSVARAYPGALQNSCQDHGGSWQFMDLVIDTLRTYDTRWGYNGKRGNANDPSHDVVTYHYGAGPDVNSTNVYIIDIIGGHCGSAPSPTWIDVTSVTANQGTIGRWISRGRF